MLVSDRQRKIFEKSERILASGMREVASELRLVDVIELIMLIQMGKSAQIRHIVSTACELYYKPGTLTYIDSAEVEIDWGAAPSICLDLKFSHNNVVVYFSLFLESGFAAIEVDHISTGDATFSSSIDDMQLLATIDQARLAPDPETGIDASLVARSSCQDWRRGVAE